MLVQAEAVCVPAAGSCSKTPGRCSPDTDCLGDTSRPFNPSVERCPETRGGEFLPCSSTGLEETSVRLESVDADVVSNNPHYFTVNVSWTVEASTSISGRYEVRLKGHGTMSRVRDCICIDHPNLLKFDFVGIDYIGNGDDTLTVEVIPYPLPFTSKILSVETMPFQRPTGCADAIIGNTICNTKIYGPSEDLTVLSSISCDGTKKLNIDWLPPSGVPHPQTYYLQVHSSDGIRLHTFEVVNTTSVVVGNLDASLIYEARLQSYRRCSGVGNYYIRDGGDEFLGCGRTASRAEELVGVCHPTTTTTTAMMTATTTGRDSTPSLFPSTTTSTTDLDIATGATALSALHLSLLSIPVIFVISGIAAVILVCSILAFKYYFSSDDDSCPEDPVSEFKVFVFYCSATPQGDVEYIQEHVVCALSQYFEVCSPSDFTRGNISTWLEETARTSTKVLLVCNQEMYQEWGKGKDREPALNSLHHLIAAAVSSNDIDRFAVVLTRKGKKETCIPKDSYIKLMRVFNLKEGSDLDDVCRFVTCSQTFQFSSATSTPTSEGPAHVAVLVE